MSVNKKNILDNLILNKGVKLEVYFLFQAKTQ